MATQAVRVLGCMVASIEGKLPGEVDDRTRLFRLREVNVFLAKAPWDLLSRDENYPTLGYILSFLLSTVTGRMANEMRLEASRGLATMLNRHLSDAFVSKVAPGVCSGLFKLLTAWEREPRELVKNSLDSIKTTLQRAWERVEAEGKLEVVLDRLVLMGPSFRQAAELRSVFLALVVALLGLGTTRNGIRLKEGHLGRLVRAVASVAAYSDDFQNIASTNGLEPFVYGNVALARLDDDLDTLLYDYSSLGEKAIAAKLEETAGLCALLSSSLWPERLGKSLLTIASRYLSTVPLLSRQGCLIGAEAIGALLWSSDTGQALARLLRIAAPLLLNLILYHECDLKVPHVLFCLASVLPGIGALDKETLTAIIDFLITLFENPEESALGEVLLDEMDRQEYLRSLSWCWVVHQLIAAAKVSSSSSSSSLSVTDLASFDYLLRPLLCHKASSKLPIGAFAAEILEELAQSSYHLASGKTLILDRIQVLLGQIASDLRYPALYPHAPRVLSQLLTAVLETRDGPSLSVDARSLVDVVREMEDRAGELHHHPGYSLLLLEALHNSLVLASKTVTVLPIDPKLGPDDEQGCRESLNHPLTLEEELAESTIRLSTHLVTHDEERVRIAALQAIAAATSVFRPDKAAEPLYPLVHLTWRPLLARLSDPSLPVARQALHVLSIQARLAGEFMRDRIQREMLPLIGALLARESETVEGRSSVQLVVEIIQNMGHAGQPTIRETIRSIIELCGRGIGVVEAIQMLLQVAQVDADQVWYSIFTSAPSTLIGDILTHPAGSHVFPNLEVRSSGTAHNWSPSQLQAMERTLAVLNQ